jgi:rod shape-determining protein MreD
MKAAGVYIVLAMALVILRTTVLGLPFFHNAVYDLLLPIVVFVRLRLPVKQGLFVVLFMGYVMDLVSGGQFGLYMTTYLWVFIGVKLISNYLSIEENFTLLVVLVVCVLFENLLFLVFSLGAGDGVFLAVRMVQPLLWQVALVVLTGPFILGILANVHYRLQGGDGK